MAKRKKAQAKGRRNAQAKSRVKANVSHRIQRASPMALAYPPHLQESAMVEELRQTIQKLRVFDSLGKTLTSSLDLTEILKIVVEKLGRLIECQNVALVLIEPNSAEWSFAYPESLQERKHGFPMGRGLIGKALERGKGELVEVPLKDSRFDPQVDNLVVADPVSVLTLPVMAKGSVLGLLAFYRAKGEKPFDIEAFRTVEMFSDYLAIAIENARNYRQIQDLTIQDDLTKLYNSRYLHLVLERELARSERYQEQLTLVFIDLDNFKSVNDRHGHIMGSQLLKEFGDFLRASVRTSDVAIRYGGDEFVLVLPRTSKAEALTFVNRLIERLHTMSFLRDRHLSLSQTASFGVATFPEDGRNIDQMICSADRAMYVVKRGSKDGVFAASRTITLIGADLKKPGSQGY